MTDTSSAELTTAAAPSDATVFKPDPISCTTWLTGAILSVAFWSSIVALTT